MTETLHPDSFSVTSTDIRQIRSNIPINVKRAIGSVRSAFTERHLANTDMIDCVRREFARDLAGLKSTPTHQENSTMDKPLFLNHNFDSQNASSKEVVQYLGELDFLHDALISHMGHANEHLSDDERKAYYMRCADYANQIEYERRRIMSIKIN